MTIFVGSVNIGANETDNLMPTGVYQRTDKAKRQLAERGRLAAAARFGSCGETPLERFESKYMPEPNTGCWIWIGSMAAGGYGQLRGFGTCARLELAHRFAWQLFKGPIADGLLALHKCDLPACVNPDHLFLGNYSDNMQDAIRKGRFGNRGRVKVGVSQLKEIQQSLESSANLAMRFGVCKRQMQRIRAKLIKLAVPSSLTN